MTAKKFSLQPTKGMRDFISLEARKMNFIKDLIAREMELFGFEPMQNPVIEDYELLAAKGGEAIKDEIYYFKDKSDREIGLRYEFTTSLARVIASNPSLKKPFKRYVVGTVYRYAQPQKNRYREFIQADADIIGCALPLADFELIQLTVNVLEKLGIKFIIRVNSRKLLEAIALSFGVKKEKISDCFRVLDKLDKIGLDEVKKELSMEKIPLSILDFVLETDFKKIEAYVKEKKLMDSGIEELRELFSLAKETDLDKFIKFDLGLARGLAYYTGIVFEVTSGLTASIAAGGRYDDLISSFGGEKTPATGISFGVDRIYDLLNEENKFKLGEEQKVLVAVIGEKALIEGIKIADGLRKNNVKALMDLMQRSLSKQLEYANALNAGKAIILGDNELKEKKALVKDLKTGKQEKIALKDIIKYFS